MTHESLVLVVPGYASPADPDCVPALRGLVRHLAHDWQVTVVALRYPYHRHAYEFDGAHVVPLAGEFARGCERLRFIGRAVRRLQEVVRSQTTFCIHALWADEPGFVGALVARHVDVPLVLSFAGGELADVPEAHYGGRRQALSPLLVGTALRGAAAITAGSQHQAAAVAELSARLRISTGIDVAPLGVDLAQFQRAGQGRDLGRGRHVVVVAANARVKGHLELLRAWPEVLRRHPNTTLHLVGARTEQLPSAPSVVAHGHVAHDEIPELLRGCDLWVQASLHESQSVALFEAVACGVPVAGTRVGWLADYDDAVASCAPGDVAGLANAVGRGLSVIRDRDTPRPSQAIVEAMGHRAAAQRFSAIYRRARRRP